MLTGWSIGKKIVLHLSRYVSYYRWSKHGLINDTLASQFISARWGVMSGRYRLYGTDFSLYTGKVRSYLLKKGIPFKEVHATARVYKRFIIPRTGVTYIPVLQTPEDEVIQDTTDIIDSLEQRHPEPSIYPETPKQRLVSLLLETYGDEWLVIPAMHYRWNFPKVNQPFIFRKFGSVVAPALPAFLRGWVGKRVGNKFKGFVPMLGITEKTIPAIEKSYTDLLADLNTHFEDHDYLMGGRPSIADFGLMGPLYAHLYHDPYPGELMRRTAPAVAAWVERMNSEEPATGDFLAGDEIAATLMPILQRMAHEQLPVLLDTDRQLAHWREQNPGAKIPRSIGEHEFAIEGVSGSRMIFPYAVWMFSRAVDFYRSLPLSGQQELDNLLRPLDFGDSLELGLRNRLVRVDKKLQFSD